MLEFTGAERIHVKSLVASLSIKRIPEAEIINGFKTQFLHYFLLK